MKNQSFFRRNFRSGPAILILLGLLLIVSLACADDTTPEGPVPVPCCPENGMRCTGGDDCINGICQKECGNNPFTQGCDCDVSGPGGGDVTWIVVVIAILTVGAGVGAKLLINSKKKAQSDKGREQEKKTRYILQLSTNKVSISPDKPGKVKIMVWKQVGEATPVQAPGAKIQLTIPADTRDILVTPSQGQGMLETTFSAAPGVSGENPEALRTIPVTVIASAEGTSTQAIIEVELTGAYAMEIY